MRSSISFNIPKRVRAEIEDKYRKKYSDSINCTKYFAYLGSEPLSRTTIAVKRASKNPKARLQMKKVAYTDVTGASIARDMDFTYLAGYQACFEDAESVWCAVPNGMFMPTADYVALDKITSTAKYKYSAIDKVVDDGIDAYSYLKMYEEFPEIEFLVKNGLSHYSLNRTFVKKCINDACFVVWLKHKKEFIPFGALAMDIIEAYRTGKSIEEVANVNSFYRSNIFRGATKFIPKNERAKAMQYILQHKISRSDYSDYIKACGYLKLDLNDTKNLMPRDFERMHDLRAHEMSIKKKLEKAEENVRMDARIKEKSNFYKQMECSSDEFSIVTLMSIVDLETEGNSLHHCVGCGVYAEKIANGRSVIFSVRRTATVNIPLATIEYDVKNEVVLQCRADHNSKPSDEVMTFVARWQEMTKNKLKQEERKYA